MAINNIDIQDDKGNSYRPMANPDSVIEFTKAGSRTNIASGDTHRTVWGKICKFFADLGTAAFCGLANNLSTTAAGYGIDARQGPVIQAQFNQINSDLGGLNFKEEAGKKYVRGADAVWVPLGSNPYIMGSERMENNIFVPSLESHNRNPTSIAPSTYCTITQPIDLTHINKIIIKIHVTNNTSSTVCKFGLGVQTAQPKSYADCEGTATKVIWTHGPTAGNLAQIIEYDVSGLAGNYYPFVYHNFPYEVGIFYWKID